MGKVDTQTPCFRIPDGATLLVVDDDPFVRRALRRMLQVEGTSVVEAADGEQALHVIARDEAQLLDAVLTDLAMPVVSGPELIAVLLECRPALPVVAMSALAQLPPDLPPVPLLQSRSVRRNWRNGRAAGPQVASDAAAGTAVARRCRRNAFTGRTATHDRKRPDGQERRSHGRLDGASPSHGGPAPPRAPRHHARAE